MILNFSDYNIIKESKTLKEFQKINPNGYAYQQVYDGFKSKGYSYFGTIIAQYKQHIDSPEEIFSVIPDDIFELAGKYAHESNYLSFIPEKDGLYFYVSDVAYKKLLPILGDNDIESVNACNKGSDLYYVLFNKEKKYFYFLNIDAKSGRYWITGFVELWLKIRNSGVDVVRKELEDIKSAVEERERIEIDKREKEKTYKNIQDAIRDDIETNEDKYEEIESYDKLPVEIKNSIEAKDGKFAKFDRFVDDNPRGSNYICYINNLDLTQGYKYKYFEKYNPRYGYWGD